MDTKSHQLVNVEDLAFDRKNPRLAELDVTHKTSDEEIIDILWKTMDVRELVLSIAASGFFPHEPLIVANEDNKQVVIEGNRRLAAVQVLLNPQLAASLHVSFPLSQQANDTLTKLPVVYGERQDAWRYLGFKHVNGPAKWSSYAKACYIAEVHRNYHIDLQDIARQIGDTHKTVLRLYRGLMVIEQAEQLEVFHRGNQFRKHFAFSHLYTGLEYPGISQFIGLSVIDEEPANPVPLAKKTELGELCLWLYGNRKEQINPVVQSQNPHLRQLDTVLGHAEGLAALRKGRTLDFALEVTKPPSNVFRDALMAAKQELQRARGTLTTGYKDSPDLRRVAHEIADLADDLCVEMDRKFPGRRRNRMEEF